MKLRSILSSLRDDLRLSRRQHSRQALGKAHHRENDADHARELETAIDESIDGLSYKPLRGDEIRLIKLLGAPDQGRVQVTLHRVSIARCPPYVALSYVWGDETDTMPIECDGRKLNVTRNLCNALSQCQELSADFKASMSNHLQSAPVEDLYFWVDAISINQADVAEKSAQIPRMGRIFSSAFTVVVWLGTVEEVCSGSVGIFQDQKPDRFSLSKLRDRLDTDFARISIGSHLVRHSAKRDVQSLAETDPMVLETFDAVLSTTWFERLWVVQEFCLSQREPMAYVGSFGFSLRLLYDFADHIIEFHTVHDLIAFNNIGPPWWKYILTVKQLTFGDKYLPAHIQSPEFQDLSAAERLWLLLNNIATKKATMPHDIIYGVLGLLQSDAGFGVHYEQPYESVCAEYTRLFIQSTSDLSVLHASYDIHKRADNEKWLAQPSWILDFRYLTTNVNPHKAPNRPHFTPDGGGLVVEGTKIGTVLVNWAATDAGYKAAEALVRDLRKFGPEFLAPVASSSDQTSNQIWRDWWCLAIQKFEWHRQVWDLNTNETFEEISDRVSEGQFDETLFRMMLSVGFCAFRLDGSNAQRDGSSHSSTVLAECVMYNTTIPNLTGSNDAPRPVEVWAVKGARFCSLFEPSFDGKSYRNVGWILVREYCKGFYETSPLDEEFFSTKTIETIMIR